MTAPRPSSPAHPQTACGSRTTGVSPVAGMLLWLAFLCLYPMIAATAARPETRPTSLPARAVVTLDPGTEIQSVALSPDGRTAYVAVSERAVPLWAVFIHFWPEWGGGLTTLLVAGLLWRL